MTAQKARAAWQGGPEAENSQRGDNTQESARSQDISRIKEISRRLAERRSEWMCVVIKHPSLSDGDKVFLLRLGLYFNKRSYRAWPGHERLAEECALSDRTVRRRLENCKSAGFIYINRRGGGVFNDGGQMRGLSNEYYLALPDGVTLKGGDEEEEPNLDTDVQVQTRTDQVETRTDRAPNPDTCCPTKTLEENPPEDSSISTPPSVGGSFLGFVGQSVSEPNLDTDVQVQGDATFPAVSEAAAELRLLTLLGEGDESEGQKIRLLLPKSFDDMKKLLIAGELQSRGIKNAIAYARAKRVGQND